MATVEELQKELEHYRSVMRHHAAVEQECLELREQNQLLLKELAQVKQEKC